MTGAAHLLALLLAVAWTSSARAEPRAPVFAPAAHESANGAVLLGWEAQSEGAGFEVERSRSPSFTDAILAYRGAEPTAHVSGLREGLHMFRVRAIANDGAASPWSDPARVHVAHHPMAIVWPLFAVGAAVFFATLAFVVVHAGGSRSGAACPTRSS